MVEQEKFDKELLKNKRIVKGTPLYRYASRFAKYFALALGCGHLALVGVTYFSNVSIEFLTAGPEQLAEGAIRLGMYDKHSEDTEMRFEQIKEDLQTSSAYSLYVDSTAYIQRLQDRIKRKDNEESTPASVPVAAEVPISTASSAVKEASK